MKVVSTLWCLSAVLLVTAARAGDIPQSEIDAERSVKANGGLRGGSGGRAAMEQEHRQLFEPGASVARVWIKFKNGKKKKACIKSLKSMVLAAGAAGDGATTQALVTPDKDAKPKYDTKSFGGSSSSSAIFQMHFDYFDMKTQSIVASVDKNMLSALVADPNVESIGRDEKRYFVGAVDKSDVTEGEHRRLQSSETIPTGITLVQADKVWAQGYKGTGVKVCVIDTGLDKGHPEYADLNLTGVSTSAGVWYTDGYGHGTHCSGTIAAGQNGLGVVGVAPEATVVPLRVFDNSGVWAYSSWVVDAAVQCQQQGANIVSMSLGGSYYSSYENSVFTTLYNQGVVSVAAAGNSGNSSFSYPASYEVVLSVAATSSSKVKASFSQFNSRVDIAAPGVSVLSSVPRASVTNGYPYQYWSGTSMATPHVAGVAALLRQKNPTASAADIIQAITATAEDLGTPGRDDSYGYGFVRALNALNYLASPPSNVPTIAPTSSPTFPLTDHPTGSPTITSSPSFAPTEPPTKAPTQPPTRKPTKTPTKFPTKQPRKVPTKKPVKKPTKKPTRRPKRVPTRRPTRRPISPS